MKHAARILSASMLLLTLAGCGWFNDDKKGPEADPKTEHGPKGQFSQQPAPICPQVAIVRALADIYDYGVEKPSPSELVAGSHMETVSGDCSYIDGGVDVTFNLSIVTARGPRLGGEYVSFPYFVAIVDPNENIIDKQRLTAEITLNSKTPTTTQDENLHVFIPLPKDNKRLGSSYRVLMGFQLTAEQRKMAVKH